MAELDHINDIDNGVVYDLKDKTARQTITENRQYLRNLLCVTTGNAGVAEQVPGYGWYNVVDITLTTIVGYFDVSAMDGAFLRIIFRESSFYDYSLPILIKAFESEYSREVFCHVYTKTDKTEELKITGTETIDFIYDIVNRCFFVVGRSSSGDLSNYYTKSQTDNLLNAKANTADLSAVATSGDYSDLNGAPTLAPVATSGDYSDLNGAPALAPVATSGDYDDLSNKPDLSVLQYLANVAAADDFNTGTSYSYLDFVKYNDRLYICIMSSGSTAGPFDPTEWTEIIIGEQVAEITRTNLLANRNENRLNNLAPVATSGNYSDLNGTPAIPAAQVNSDWNASAGVAEILNKPNLSAVATSGDYSDLNGAPTLAAVATSGLYADLAGTPTLAPVATSGDYDDLTDKPTFKTINGNAITGTGNVETALNRSGSFSLQFNGLSGFFSNGSTQAEIFVPVPGLTRAPTLSDVRLCIRASEYPNTSYPYPYIMRNSSTYDPIDYNHQCYFRQNGSNTTGVNTCNVSRWNVGGFNLNIVLANPFKWRTGASTYQNVKNNIPISVNVLISGTY